MAARGNIIDNLTIFSTFYKEEEYTYLAALSAKKLKLYPEANQHYSELGRHIRKTLGKSLIKYIFSITLLPLQNDRKLVEDYLQNLEELISSHDPKSSEMDVKLAKVLDGLQHSNGKWVNVETAVKILHGLSLFKRMSKDDLREVMPKAVLKEAKQGECLFCEDKVLIILNGKAIIRSHDSGIDKISVKAQL